jgi:hypothetical protein
LTCDFESVVGDEIEAKDTAERRETKEALCVWDTCHTALAFFLQKEQERAVYKILAVMEPDKTVISKTYGRGPDAQPSC